jgi:ribosomal protein S18 acetylase RimI-like enzyme
MTRAVRTVPASELSLATMTNLFNRGYAGYYVPLTLTEPVFREMVATQDIDLASSRVFEGDEGPVAFALLGVRGTRGWIGGLGVVEEARGRGLGREAMRAVLDEARVRRLDPVDLEVLVQNTPAIPIYEALGFRDLRELGIWVREAATPAGAGAEASAGGSPMNTASPEDPGTAGPRVEPLEAGECLARYDEMERARPSWQRERRVFERLRDTVSALGIRENGAWKAWVAFRVHPGQLRIVDLAYAPGSADRLDACLAGLLRAHPAASATYLNVPMDAIEAPALERAGFMPRQRQREMRLVNS